MVTPSFLIPLLRYSTHFRADLSQRSVHYLSMKLAERRKKTRKGSSNVVALILATGPE